MKDIKPIIMNKITIFVIFLVLGVTVAIVFGYRSTKNSSVSQAFALSKNAGDNAGSPANSENLSKVVLSVSEMSCSGCISTIKGSLAGFGAIQDVLVDVRGAKAEVYYDSGKFSDTAQFADAITAAGYPAKVIRTVSSQDMKKSQKINDEKARLYVASVNGWDIAQADLNTELGILTKKYSKIYGNEIFGTPKGQGLMDNFRSQIVSSLIDEGIVMQEVQKLGYRINRETVDQEFKEYLKEIDKDLEDFKNSLAEVGYDFDYFQKKFERKVLINSYIDEMIIADASNPVESQNMINAWFNNAKLLSEVVYYDKAIENIMKNQSSSGSCCSAG